jgi:hypothetical protein
VNSTRTIFRNRYTTIRNNIEKFRFAQSKINTGEEYCYMLKHASPGEEPPFKSPKLMVDPSYWNIIDAVYRLTGRQQRSLKEYTTTPDQSTVVWSKLNKSIPYRAVYDFSGTTTWDSGSSLKILNRDNADGIEPSVRTNEAFDTDMTVRIIPGRQELENTPFGYFTWDGTRYGTNIKYNRGNTMTYSPFWPVFGYEMIDHVLFSGKQPQHSFVSIIRPLLKKPLRVISYAKTNKDCLRGTIYDEFESPIWYDLSDHYPIIGRFIFRDTPVPELTNLDHLNDTHYYLSSGNPQRIIENWKKEEFAVENCPRTHPIILKVGDEDCQQK